MSVIEKVAEKISSEMKRQGITAYSPSMANIMVMNLGFDSSMSERILAEVRDSFNAVTSAPTLTQKKDPWGNSNPYAKHFGAPAARPSAPAAPKAESQAQRIAREIMEKEQRAKNEVTNEVNSAVDTASRSILTIASVMSNIILCLKSAKGYKATLDNYVANFGTSIAPFEKKHGDSLDEDLKDQIEGISDIFVDDIGDFDDLIESAEEYKKWLENERKSEIIDNIKSVPR